MQHVMKISVSRSLHDSGLVSCRSVTMRERFLRFLFGDKRQVMIFVPGDRVDEVSIHETEKGDTTDEK